MNRFIKSAYAASLCCAFISCNNNGQPPSSQPDTYAVPTEKRIDTTVARSGEEIFTAKCIFCHGQQGNRANMGAENLQVSLVDSLTIVQVIKNGRGKMPPFDDQFSDTEMSTLVDYVKGLRKTQ